MSNKRLIDGTALMNRINITATRHRNDGASLSASILTLIHNEIESGVFDIPSNQRLIDSKALLEWIEKSPDADGFWDGTNVTRSVKAFDNLEDAINSGRFDVSNQRLIDGMSDTISKQALLERIEEISGDHTLTRMFAKRLLREIISGRLDVSNQGEAEPSEISESIEAAQYNEGWRTWVAMVRADTLKSTQGEAARNAFPRQPEKEGGWTIKTDYLEQLSKQI